MSILKSCTSSQGNPRFKCSSVYELNPAVRLPAHELRRVNDHCLRFKYGAVAARVPVQRTLSLQQKGKGQLEANVTYKCPRIFTAGIFFRKEFTKRLTLPFRTGLILSRAHSLDGWRAGDTDPGLNPRVHLQTKFNFELNSPALCNLLGGAAA